MFLWGQEPVWLHNRAVVEANQVVSNDSIITVGGIFQEELQGKTSQGGVDIFFYQYNSQQQLLGKYHLGGTGKEHLAALAGLAEGGWYGVGSFEDSLFFGAKDTLLLEQGSSFFVGKWQGQQQLEWARTLTSTGFMQVWDAKSDAAGNLYLTGSFRDSLLLDSFPPLVASCTEAPFLLQINPQGQIVWGISSPMCQEATGKSLALDEQGNLYWVGEFRGVFQLKDTFEKAHVVYRDLFLVRVEVQTGEVLTQKQFTGVYDNQCTALEYANNKLYLAGQFSGYLQLDSFLLRTAFKTFSNAYLAELDSNGQTLWATQSSAFADASVTTLAVKGKRIALGGYYQDSLLWEEEKASSVHKSEAFFLNFYDKKIETLVTGQGAGFDVVRGVVIEEQDYSWWVGGFQDSIVLGNTLGIAQGYSDGFIWRRKAALGSFNKYPSPSPSFLFSQLQLSPQPAQDSCFINLPKGVLLESWQLYNTKGQLIQTGQSPFILTSQLPQKVYSLHVYTSEGLAIEKLLVE